MAGRDAGRRMSRGQELATGLPIGPASNGMDCEARATLHKISKLSIVDPSRRRPLHYVRAMGNVLEGA
jgi:hypothetical protein